jgi:hypothetical protein
MSQIFRKNFENVRVHTDEPAIGYTRQMGAEAFTVGQHIFFGAGRYQPDTPIGQALLGHELTHVVQQASLPSLGGGRIPETSTAGRAFEHEAINNESLILRHLSSSQPKNSGGAGSHSSHDSLIFPVEQSFVPMEPLHLRPTSLQRSLDLDRGSVIERELTGITSYQKPGTAPTGGGAAPTGGATTADAAPTGGNAKSKEPLDKAVVNSIVQEVYRQLKQQLMHDRERHGARSGLLL